MLSSSRPTRAGEPSEQPAPYVRTAAAGRQRPGRRGSYATDGGPRIPHDSQESACTFHRVDGCGPSLLPWPPRPWSGGSILPARWAGDLERGHTEGRRLDRAAGWGPARASVRAWVVALGTPGDTPRHMEAVLFAPSMSASPTYRTPDVLVAASVVAGSRAELLEFHAWRAVRASMCFGVACVALLISFVV
jgi:hypothetical protein